MDKIIALSMPVSKYIFALLDKASRSRLLLSYEAGATAAERSHRSNGSRKNTEPVAVIKHAVYKGPDRHHVYFISDGRLQVARGSQIRTLLDSGRFVLDRNQVLRRVSSTAGTNIGSENSKRSKAVAQKKQKRSTSKR